MRKFPTLSEAWEKCERADWMMCVLVHGHMLDKPTSLKLAAAFRGTISQRERASAGWIESLRLGVILMRQEMLGRRATPVRLPLCTPAAGISMTASSPSKCAGKPIKSGKSPGIHSKDGDSDRGERVGLPKRTVSHRL